MGDSLSGIPPPPPGFTDEVPPPPEGFTEEIPPPPAGFTEELTPPANARDPSFLGGLGQDWRRGTASLYQNWAGTRASALQTLEQNQGLVEAYPGGPKVPILPDPTDPTKAAPETQQAIQAGYTDVASDLVRHQATIAANPAPQSVQDIAKAGNDRDFAAAWTAFKTHPLEAIASTTVGSLPQMLAAMGIGVVTRNPGLSAATMGLTSGASEWGNAIVDALQDAAKARNIPLTAETAAMLMQDPALMAAARERGAIRGLVVGGFDALSGGMAGFNFVPKQLVKGAVTRELANLVPQALSQGVMGGAGEAGGEYLATGQVKWGDALLEVIGEFGGAPIEVATMGGGHISERLNAASARRQAGQAPAPGDVDAVQAGLGMLDTAIAEARAKGNEAAATKMQAARDQMAVNFTGATDTTAAATKVIDRSAQDELAAVQQRQNAGVSPESLTEAQRREAGIVPGMPEAEAIRRAMIYEDEQRVLRGEITGQPQDVQPPALPGVIALPDRSLAAPGDTTPLNRGTPVGDLPGLVQGAELRGGGTGAALVPTQPQAQRMTPEEIAAAQQQTRQADREQAARGQEPQADVSDIDAQIGRIDKLLSGTNLDPPSRTKLEAQRERLAQTRADRLGIGRPMTGGPEGQARSAGQQEMVQTAEEMQAADREKASNAFAQAERQRMRTYTDEQLNTIADAEGDPRAPHAALELRRRQRGEAGQAGMDTQPAGMTTGPERTQVTTHVQDGLEHPVKVLQRDAAGRALVQRYDPRTGEVEPDSRPYIVNAKDLNTRTYTQQPRQAQDVTQRAEVGRVSEGRAKGQRIDTVQGLPAQTYRVTPEDPNAQFPGTEAERDTGRSPIPEQSDQPRRTWTREEQFMRDYAAREEQRRQRDEEAQRQRRERGQSEEQPKPKGKKGERSTNEAKAVDGAFPVDADGHVVSTGGGPIIFGTQLQTAKWILNVGHKESARQIFQIANHPTTNNTFSVQETGLSDEPSAGPDEQAGPAADEAGPTPKPPPPTSPPQLGGPTPPPSPGSAPGGGGSAGPAAPSGSGTEPGGSPASGGGGSPGGPAPTAAATPEPEPTDPRSGPFPHDEQFGGEAMMLLSAQVSLDRVARGANPEWVKAQAQAQYDQALADMRRKGATEQQIKDIQENIAARRAATDAERAARAGEGQQATPEPQAEGDVKPGEPGPHPTMTRLAAPVPTKPGQRTETENHLLIVQCSDTKSTAPGEIAAIDRYDGPFARQIRALEKGLRPTILFISGKFGLVGGDQALPNYDQSLNAERVDALQRDDEVTGQRLEDYINEGQFESVLLLGGENYRVAIGDHLHNAVEVSENTPPALEQPTGDLLNLRKELGSWLRAIQPGSPPRYATEAGPQASAETTAAPAAPAGLSPVERARRLDTPEVNSLQAQIAKLDAALDKAGTKYDKANAVLGSDNATTEQRARAQAALRAAIDEQTKLNNQRGKLVETLNNLRDKLLAPEPAAEAAATTAATTATTATPQETATATAATPAATTATPGKREQTARGKEAQSVAVEGIRYAARESPVGQWMGNFEARIFTNSPVMAAILNRVPAALRPFITRAAYAGVNAVNAEGGVEAAKAARLAAIRQINSEAVAAMKGDAENAATSSARSAGKSAAEHALSRRFSEDLTHAFNRGEDVAGQMQEEGKAIPEQRQIDATARTSRGQATTYQFGSAAAAEATAERLSKQSGATFYSFPGMLFDPQMWKGVGKGVAALGKLLTGTREDWEQFHGTMTALGTSLSNLASNVTQAPAAFASGVMTVMERTVGAAVRSGGGALRAMARARNSPTLLQLVNDLDAPSRSQYGGEGSGVRPFNEAFKIKRNNVGRQITALTERLTELVKSAPKQPGESAAARIERVHDQLAKMVRNPGGRRGELGKLATDVAALLKGLRDYAVAAGVEMGNVGAGYLPRMFNADTVAAKPAEFLKIARDAYIRQGVPFADAKNYAQQLLQDVQKGGFGIPGHSGAFAGAPASVKSRTFDSQAERAFQNEGLYVNDVERLLLTYRDQIIRRAEIARRWGDGWKDWHDKVIAPLIAEPGNNDAWLGNYAANYAETITGVKPTVGSRGIQNTLGALRAATAFSALNEVAITSLLEATAVANRTGRADEAVRALFGSFHEAYRDIRKLPPSQQRQVAEDLGLLAGDVLASAQAGRFGAGDGTRMELAKKEARFYRTIKLEQITNGQYVSVAQSGIRMLDRAAEGIMGNASWMSPERGKSVLSELGIPADKAEAFARYWQSIRRDNQGKNTRQPLPEHYATALGEMAQTALYRFVTQTIQTPDAGSKPRWASTTFGSLVFNLNSFAWAFARNVTIANFKLAGKAITGKDTGTGLKGLADRAAYLAPAIIGTGMAMMANYAVIGIKDAFGGTDDEDIERRTNGWWWEQVARRSGLLMVADPIIQASMAGIYGREPITSLSGPSVGILAELLSAGNQLIVKNSEKSNSAERRAAQAAFDAVVKPAAIYMLLAASVPGALNMATVVGAGWKGTRRLFTDTTAGEESDTNKMRRQRKPQQGYFEQVFGGES